MGGFVSQLKLSVCRRRSLVSSSFVLLEGEKSHRPFIRVSDYAGCSSE